MCETGTDQQVAQLHDSYLMALVVIIIIIIIIIITMTTYNTLLMCW
jgi:hypothetical protein